MKIHKSYRYELKLNLNQTILCFKHAGVARFAYNWGLKQRIDLYEKHKTSTNAITQHRFLNSLKENEFPWMYEVSKCAPQEALRDLDKAFNNFFRGLKNKQKVGFPAFKKKGLRDAFRLTGTIKVNKKSIQLPRLGTIHLKETTEVKGKILSVTISREADRWYVSIPVEQEMEEFKGQKSGVIGLDLGLTSYITTSNGEKSAASKSLDKHLNRLKKASLDHSRKIKGSNNRKKSALRLSRVHRKIKNCRLDFQHQLSTKLAKTKSVIVVEDLDVRKMLQNKRLSRQISDAGWSSFIRMLEYKTKWYGSQLVKVPRFYPSSKRCSCCGYIIESLHLNERSWICPKCQVTHDRDVNAALNILYYHTGSSPEINACGDSSSEVSQKLTSYESLNQEFHKL